MGFFSRAFTLGKILPIALIAVLLVGLGAYLQGRSDGKTSIKLANQKAITAAQERGRIAGERAAETRLADERRQFEVEKKYEQAIEAAPGGSNSPAAVALAVRGQGCRPSRRLSISRKPLIPSPFQRLRS